jgi:putative redox protein
MKFFGYDDQHHQTVLDSAEEGILTAGPAPVQIFLQALAGCSGMDIVHILQKRRLEINSFNIEVEGTRLRTSPKIFNRIKIKYIISGAGISREEMERAVSMSINKLCSVIGMIDRNKTEIEIEYKII